MYHPADASEANAVGEWVELHNQMAVDIDLSGWRVSGGVDFEFATGTVLGGGESLVVAADPDALEASGIDPQIVFGPFDGNLSNGGERLRLRSNNNRIMDEVDYGDGGRWPVAPDGSGVTLAKFDPDTGSADPDNWTFSEQIGGTPGALNFAESLPPPPPESTNLLGFYQFDGNYLDSSESARHGSPAGNVSFSNSGFEGQAVSFSGGASDFVQVQIDASPQNNPTVTWGAWVKSSQPDGNINTILSNDNGGWDRFLFHDGNRWSISNGLGIQKSSVATSTDWTFIAASFDGTNQRLYVDSNTPVLTAGDPNGPSLTHVDIGRNANACGICAWSGLIDNVFIFDDVLSDAEIAGIRAGGAAAILALEQGNDGGGNTEPVDLPSLKINEVASSLDAMFQVEIVNTGDEPVSLAGIVLSSSVAGTAEFVFGDQTLAAGAFVALDAAQLGYGASDGDRLFLYGQEKAGVIDAAVVKDRLRGRSDQHDGRWLWPAEATFGAANQFAFHDEIVINEIFYHGYPQRAEGNVPFAESEEEWIELYNRGVTETDLSGWRLDDGVGFVFPAGTMLGAGEYLVVAKDAAAVQAKYPSIDVIGDFSGRLNNRSERIELRDAANNPADEVEYYDDGRWSQRADGGGSSLELRDPNADNSRAEAWSASDESDRAAWQTYTYRGVATNDGIGYEIWNEFVLGLLTAGEVLLDNISVIESPNGSPPIQLIQNGSFQSDAIGSAPAKWRAIGNHGSHGRTVVEADPVDPNNRVLHVTATGSTEHMHNHVTTTFVGNRRVQVGREYEISFDAKWLGGSNQFNTRLYFNWLQRTTLLVVPTGGGTPGEQNSTFEENAAPTYENFRHEPVVPAAGAPVTVSVSADDPQGVASMTLWYRVNTSTWRSVTMNEQATGQFAGTIPGQSSSAVVQFYVEGRDTTGAVSTFPAEGRASRTLYIVEDNRANLDELHNFRIIMTAADRDFLYSSTNRMSNDRIGATVIYDERTVYYDVGVRLKGSAFGRNNDAHAGFNIEFHPDRLFRGVHGTIAIERGPANQLLAKHLFNVAGGGLGNMFDDVARIITPRTQDTGIALLSMARYSEVFVESQFESGGDGTVYNLELLYTPTSTVNGNPEAAKRNFPYSHTNGNFEIQDFGDDKETYRSINQIRSNRSKDDFGPMIALAQALELNGAALDAATQQVMDVDQWMRSFAMMSLVGNDDLYTRSWNHNFRMYLRPEDNKMLALPWDLDRAFRISTNASLWGGTQLAKVINLPANRRLFHGHLYDMIGTVFNTDYISPWVSHFSNLTGQSLGSDLNWIGGRASNVLRMLPADFPFEITSGNSIDVSDPFATITGRGWIDVREIRLAGSDDPLQVEWIDDESWRITLPVQFGPNAFDIEAYDHQGNLVGSGSIVVTSTSRDPRLQDSLRISEIHYNPADPPLPDVTKNGQFEFIELVNVGTETLDLSGVAFVDGVSFEFDAAGVTSLAAGDYLVVVRSKAAFLSRYEGFDTSLIAGEFDSGQLDNGGEKITLVDRFGATIQEFSYRDGWHKLTDGEGFSLSIIDATADVTTWGDAGAWRPSSLVHGSPGADDPRLLPNPGQLVINELLAHTDQAGGDWVELYNKTDTAIPVGGWYLSDDPGMFRKYRIAAGTTVPARGYLVFGEQTHFNNIADSGALVPFAFSELGDEVFLQAADPASGALLGFASERNFGASPRDVTFGHVLKSDGGDDFTALIAPTRGASNTPPRVGPIVIEEIMYNPSQGGEEFIELKNISGGPLPLFDPARPTNTWAFTSGIGFAFPPDITLPSGALALVVPSDPAAFRAAHNVPADVAIFGPYLNLLNNAGEKIEISRPGEPDPDGTVPMIAVDRVTYNDKAPWPLQADGEGWSLQRIASDAYGNDPINWGVTIPGGTPGSFVVAPRVSEVFVSGSSWAPQAAGTLGEAGFSIPAGTAQVQTVAWTGIDRVSIRFSEDVDVSLRDLRLFGANVLVYQVDDFDYDDTSFIATWTLHDPIGADRLRLEVSDEVTDHAGLPLDGNWTNAASSFPSGNGAIDLADDTFRFRFNVLPGDVTSGGMVERRDLLAVIGALGSDTARPRYNARLDVDLDGSIGLDDLRAVLLRQGSQLPSAEPHEVGDGPPRIAVDEVFQRIGQAGPSPAATVRSVTARRVRQATATPVSTLWASTRSNRAVRRLQATAVDRAIVNVAAHLTARPDTIRAQHARRA
jgi:hypothetical protein